MPAPRTRIGFITCCTSRDEVHLCGRVGGGDAWVGELKQFVRQVCVMAPVGGMDFQGCF